MAASKGIRRLKSNMPNEDELIAIEKVEAIRLRAEARKRASIKFNEEIDKEANKYDEQD